MVVTVCQESKLFPIILSLFLSFTAKKICHQSNYKEKSAKSGAVDANFLKLSLKWLFYFISFHMNRYPAFNTRYPLNPLGLFQEPFHPANADKPPQVYHRCSLGINMPSTAIKAPLYQSLHLKAD